MTPNHKSMLYEGKAKRIYSSEIPGEVFVEFKNDATAFNAKKRAQFEGKGSLNCQISAFIFKFLESKGVPTHYLDINGDNWMLVQKVEVLPLEIVIRNVASGSLCKETPIEPGTKLCTPLLDLYYKDDDLGDPLLTDERISLLALVSSTKLLEIKTLALTVNGHLQEFFKKLNLLLVDFKLEMGLTKNGQLVVADEISPDSCRIWDLNTYDQEDRILDKDRFRRDLGGVLEGYSEVLRRIQEFSS